MGRIADREIAIINFFVGGLTALVAAFMAFGPGADAASIKGAALTLLFTFTYLIWRKGRAIAATRLASLARGDMPLRFPAFHGRANDRITKSREKTRCL